MVFIKGSTPPVEGTSALLEARLPSRRLGLPHCLPLKSELSPEVAQKDHSGQGAEQTAQIEPSENSPMVEYIRIGKADRRSASDQEKKNKGKPHLPVENGSTAAAELCAPVANAGKEGYRHHAQGKNNHMQHGTFEIRVALDHGKNEEKQSCGKEAVVEMGGHGVEHEGVIDIPAKTRNSPATGILTRLS